MLQWLYAYVVNVCSKCFIYFEMYVIVSVSCCKCFMSRRGKRAHAVPACVREAERAQAVHTSVRVEWSGVARVVPVRASESRVRVDVQQAWVSVQTYGH